MPQRYKLRLSDGTFLSVDVDGLRAWTHDGAALAQALGSQQWRPLKQVLAEEENAERLLRALIPPKPKKDAAPEPSAPVAAPVEEPRPVEAPRPGDLDLPPLDPPSFASGTPSFGQPLAFGEPAFGDPPPVSDSPAFSEPTFREPAGAPLAAPASQVLAEETSSSSPDINDASLPAIRLKPLVEDSGFRSAWEDGEAEEEEQPRHEQGPLVAILGPLGGFLSGLLTRLAPLFHRFSSRASREEVSYSRRSESSSSRDEDGGPTLGEKLTTAWSGLTERLTEAWSGLTERLAETWRGLTARLRRSESAPEADDEDEIESEPQRELEVPRLARAPLPPRSFDAPEPHSPLPPMVPRPASPPKPISQLPVVPLAAAVDEPEPEPDEVYEGEEPSALMGPLWFWTKRIIVLGLLAAAGSYLYRERARWFPQAADVGQIVFKQIDKRARAGQLNQKQQQALVEATARLPHLTPPTILMIYEQSPLGVMDASEVFQLTREATERGIDKLPPTDAEELRALQNDLAANLRPPERRRLDEYDEARARRVIFPFENPYAMDLVAKGARALPSEKLVRLRALLQQAVAEGLKVPPADSDTSASPAPTPTPASTP
ncbi:MAG TPA: hypothetical protein VII62_15210 [Vicinamibacteria bacterium]